MIAHLLESTLLLAIAILIAHIPRLAARTRYTIVFAALVKFAIPSAIVPRLLAAFGIDLTGMKGTIVISAMGPLSMVNLPQNAPAIWPMILIAIWAVIAVALLARSFVRGRTSVRRALANAFPPNDGDLAALASACKRASVKNEIQLVRSQSVATPVTVGLLRPIIIIPSSSELAGEELETILTHECAHIARRDNLLSVIESIAGSALWFHPLVWIARRVLDAAREEACDAVVISSGSSTIYVSALGKVCGAAIAPRAAGISCIVSNTIQERMNAIMRFGTRRLLPHRAITTASIALIAVATIGSGIAKALPATTTAETPSRYEVRASATRDASSNFVFNVTVRNRETGEITTSHFQTAANEPLTRKWGSVDKNGIEQETVVRAVGYDNGTATVNVDIKGEAPILIRIVPKTATANTSSSDEPISLDLKDADIRDVLRTFAKLTNTDIVADPEITGKVTVSLHEIPWTEALEKILTDANLRQERLGNAIHVHRN
jgi:beta-lactamase regulating signal transducer with metallopeptidase domain